MNGNDSNILALPELYDFLLKFIIIGDSGVGKSCLMHHFLNESVRDPSPHTIGVEFSSTLMRLPSSTPIAAGASGSRATNSKTLKVQLWDTAGQERFRSVTRNYYRGACGAIVVYDITSRKSFESLGQWLADARALASPDLAVVLVGNKLDQEEWRQVPYLEASRWAQDHGIMFMETSSLSGENVEQPFILLARSILLAIESGQLDPEKTGSGVSYGERSLRRVSSWGSNLRPSRIGVFAGKCC
ncbi:rab family, other [Microbotryum lychnidis-dioicae p1A1 Lamole]|uniref:Rab family, other n=1 Tax=Microbotryum lychnidis-dioicae (strain p1A1 Lamole / MvSl-1064) TaxID=683840 RepID=U5GZK3_USTV1|nr:rab family, other [Microbotryum lychnidis-dioicae p1A1 Lamole]|eukprot:KDE09285.1 rab family, other [Microbotryum lychnidis-dioicae p1A1 Lamole]